MDEVDNSMCFSDKAQSTKKNSYKSQDELLDENYS